MGGSCGLAVEAALRVAETAGPDDVIVVLLPDGGRGYLGKIFNDEWMSDYGFLSADTEEATAGKVLSDKEGEMPDFVHSHPDETVGTAVAIMREYGVSQLPVMKEEPPVMAAEVVGSIAERDLLDALFDGRADLDDLVETHMAKPLSTVGTGTPVSDCVRLLRRSGALVVLLDGKPVGILTRQDLLAHLSG